MMVDCFTLAMRIRRALARWFPRSLAYCAFDDDSVYLCHEDITYRIVVMLEDRPEYQNVKPVWPT